MFCPQCGYPLTQGNEKYCPSCGIKLLGQPEELASQKNTSSIGIADTKGDVIGVGVSGSSNTIIKEGSYTIQGNFINLNIGSPQSREVQELLKKITTFPTQVHHTSGTTIENRQVSNLQGSKGTEENISSLLNDVRKIENKTGNKIEGIKAGEIEVSKNELLSREYFLKGHGYAYKNDDYNALKWLDKAIKIKPDYVDAWHYRGISLHELGRYDEAIKI